MKSSLEDRIATLETTVAVMAENQAKLTQILIGLKAAAAEFQAPASPLIGIAPPKLELN